MSVKTAVGRSEKVHGGIWLHKQATMNRAQNSFVDEQLAQIQSAHDELRCYFADHKTMQMRPATTYDLTAESRIWLLDTREAPNRELEANRQHMRNMQPYMLIAQHNDDSPNDEYLRALCEQQTNQGSYFLLNLWSCPKEQNSNWDTVLGFRTNLPGLIRSFAETGEDLHLHFDSARRIAEAAVESGWTARKLNESIRSCRRNCARHSKPKRRLTLRVTRQSAARAFSPGCQKPPGGDITT